MPKIYDYIDKLILNIKNDNMKFIDEKDNFSDMYSLKDVKEGNVFIVKKDYHFDNQRTLYVYKNDTFRFLGIMTKTDLDMRNYYNKEQIDMKFEIYNNEKLFIKSDVEPENKELVWVDTSSDEWVIKIYNGEKWITISGKASIIEIDSEMSDISKNTVENNVIKKYVDNRVDTIHKYQKYVNTDLDFIRVGISDLHAGLDLYDVDTVIPFDSIITCNNMRLNSDYSINLKANKTYEILVDLYSPSATYVNCIIKDINLDKVIGKIIKNNKCSNIETNIGYALYTPDVDTKIQVIIDDLSTFKLPTTSYNLTYANYISVKEVNRAMVIDPVDYANELKGIEDNPVGHIMSQVGTVIPKHYLVCDGSQYNIADYPYLAQHFVDNFDKVNYFGGDGITTFAVPDLKNTFNCTQCMNIPEYILTCIKCEPTYYLKNIYAGFKRENIWEGNLVCTLSEEEVYPVQSIELPESILNYDTIELYYRSNNSTTGTQGIKRMLSINPHEYSDFRNDNNYIYLTCDDNGHSINIVMYFSNTRTLKITDLFIVGNLNNMTKDGIELYKIVGLCSKSITVDSNDPDYNPDNDPDVSYDDDDLQEDIEDILDGEDNNNTIIEDNTDDTTGDTTNENTSESTEEDDETLGEDIDNILNG